MINALLLARCLIEQAEAHVVVLLFRLFLLLLLLGFLGTTGSWSARGSGSGLSSSQSFRVLQQFLQLQRHEYVHQKNQGSLYAGDR